MGDLNISWGDKIIIENKHCYGDDEESLAFRDSVKPVTNITIDCDMYFVNGKDAEYNFAWGTEKIQK